MRSDSKPSREGTRLLFAGGTVSPMMCPADGRQKGRQKRSAEKEAKTMAETSGQKKKRRPQQGDGFSLMLFFPGVLGSSGVISHDDSR